MKTIYTPAFDKDLKNLKDRTLLKRIETALINAEKARNLAEISQVKKLEGGSNHYRIRVGDYRLGFVVQEDVLIFKCCRHRSKIYGTFP